RGRGGQRGFGEEKFPVAGVVPPFPAWNGTGQKPGLSGVDFAMLAAVSQRPAATHSNQQCQFAARPPRRAVPAQSMKPEKTVVRGGDDFLLDEARAGVYDARPLLPPAERIVGGDALVIEYVQA